MAARGSIPTVMKQAGIDMLPPEAGIPVVRRELTSGTAGELVIGNRLGILVEEFDPQGGLDTSGNGSADSFVTAANVSNPAQVISVQIGLLVSSPDKVGATNSAGPFDVIGTSILASDDKRLRRVYSTTVLLRNRLG